MTDHTKLIAQLRLGASISRDRNLNLDFAKVADESAEALEAAQAELEEWRFTNRIDELQRAHDQALARLAELEAEIARWEKPFDQERFDDARKAASHKDSLAAMGVYITALEHALKHAAAAGASPVQPSQAGELSDTQRLYIVTNWFSDEADITRAMQMLTDFEQTSAAINAKGGN